MTIWDACVHPNTRAYEVSIVGLVFALAGVIVLFEASRRWVGATIITLGLVFAAGVASAVHRDVLEACSALRDEAHQVEGPVHILEHWGADSACWGETIRVGDLVFYLRNESDSVYYKRPSCAGGLLVEGAVARISYSVPPRPVPSPVPVREMLRVQILHDPRDTDQ